MHDSLRAETILAIDHGERRIGLAIKPAGETYGLPLAVIQTGRTGAAEAELRRLIAERGVTLVAVGLPVNDDPDQAAAVKRFARRLRQGVTGARWRFVDESHSTQTAELRAREGGRAGRGVRVDDLAALEILNRFMQEEISRVRRESADGAAEPEVQA